MRYTEVGCKACSFEPKSHTQPNSLAGKHNSSIGFYITDLAVAAETPHNEERAIA